MHQDEGVKPSDNNTVQAQNDEPSVADDDNHQNEDVKPSDNNTVLAQIDEQSVADNDNHQNEAVKPSDNNTVQAQNNELPAADAGNDSNTESKPLSDKELDQLLKKYKYKKVNNYTTEIQKKKGMLLTFTYIWAESKTGNRISFPDTFKAIVQEKNGNYYAVFSDGTIDSIANDFFIDLRNDKDYKNCTAKYACGFPTPPIHMFMMSKIENPSVYKRTSYNHADRFRQLLINEVVQISP